MEHFGHTVTRKDYYKHAQNRRLDEGEKEYLKELMSTNASARNIAQCLSQKTGREYNRQDVQNLTRKLSEKDEEPPSVEAILGNIQDNGGNVSYSRDENNCVDVLMIQTHDMVDLLKRENPRVYKSDTTFGTSKEGYKLHVLIYHSNTTDMWEIAALIFLSSETREKVQTGLAFFRDSLLKYKLQVENLLFFADKDFDYISVSYFETFGFMPMFFERWSVALKMTPLFQSNLMPAFS